MLNQSASNRLREGTPGTGKFLILMLLAIAAGLVLLYFGGMFSAIDAKIHKPGAVLQLKISPYSYLSATIGSTRVARRAGK